MTKEEFEKLLDSIADQLTQEARAKPFKVALERWSTTTLTTQKSK